jgi:hypothetical protein
MTPTIFCGSVQLDLTEEELSDLIHALVWALCRVGPQEESVAQIGSWLRMASELQNLKRKAFP